MFGLFNKKDEKIDETEDPTETLGSILVMKKYTQEKSTMPKETVIIEKETAINETKEIDKLTSEYIDMGLDMKNEVAKFSKAFFNSKNKLKEESYLRFQSFLASVPYDKKNEIQNIKYLTFKEKEEQILNTLKNGFAQFLSKGSHIDEESKTTIDLVFGDIKKMPSRGHRYWYYKIYIWQKREN